MNTKFYFRSFPYFLALSVLTLTFLACDDEENITPIDNETAASVFLSSNTSGMVGVLDLTEVPSSVRTFPADGMDADGIYYDEIRNMLYQINRTDNTLVAYRDLAVNQTDFSTVATDFVSSSDFQNGRGLAVSGNRFVVAQDANDSAPNQFVVYQQNGNSFTKTTNVETDINLWGIQFVGNDLYAIVDNSDQLAIFENFLTNATGSNIAPDRTITIEGIVRTHGLEYDAEDDVLILTDVGEASSDDDGALITIPNWSIVQSSTSIGAATYTRIAGQNTFLGNPVDVDYDATTNRIYVAERAREGGLLLVFPIGASGEAAPDQNITFPGLSSLYLFRK